MALVWPVSTPRPVRRGRAPPPFAELRRAEAAALGLAATGLCNQAIAARLDCSEGQVRRLLRQARVALGVETERAALALYWRRLAQHVVGRAS